MNQVVGELPLEDQLDVDATIFTCEDEETRVSWREESGQSVAWRILAKKGEKEEELPSGQRFKLFRNEACRDQSNFFKILYRSNGI